jgi:hypothetical protein
MQNGIRQRQARQNFPIKTIHGNSPCVWDISRSQARLAREVASTLDVDISGQETRAQRGTAPNAEAFGRRQQTWQTASARR